MQDLIFIATLYQLGDSIYNKALEMGRSPIQAENKQEEFKLFLGYWAMKTYILTGMGDS